MFFCVLSMQPQSRLITLSGSPGPAGTKDGGRFWTRATTVNCTGASSSSSWRALGSGGRGAASAVFHGRFLWGVSERDCGEALLNEQFICSQQSFFFRAPRQVLIVRLDISTPPLLFLWLFSSPSSHQPARPPAIRNWIWSRTIHLVSLLHLYPPLPASTPPL